MSDLETCKLLLARLQRGELVAAPELKRALGEEHWTDYQLHREWVKERRAEAKIASSELRDYVVMLRIADLRQSQADRMRVRTGKLLPRGKRPYDRYEQALRRLSELIEGNSSLAEFLDRPFQPYSWSSNTNVSPDKEGVPRLWFHTENALPQNAERQIKTIRQIKMDALQRAIDAQPSHHRLARNPSLKFPSRPQTR